MVTRTKDVDLDKFQVTLQAEEAGSVPGAELIGWFAMDASNNARQYVGTDVTSDDPKSFNFDYDPSTETTTTLEQPHFFMSMQTTNGGDTATLRYNGLSFTSVTVRVEEEKSANEENEHLDEEIGIMALRAGAFTHVEPPVPVPVEAPVAPVPVPPLVAPEEPTDDHTVRAS
jgi:hypothetical protein